LNWIIRGSSSGRLRPVSLQLGVVDLAVGANGFVEFLRIDLGGLARFEVDSASGEVHAERDQAGDHIEQQAHRIEHGNGRVDLAVDLATAVRVEDRTAGRQLAQQGDGEDTANDTGSDTHNILLNTIDTGLYDNTAEQHRSNVGAGLPAMAPPRLI
jgi:hypothetical protein